MEASGYENSLSPLIRLFHNFERGQVTVGAGYSFGIEQRRSYMRSRVSVTTRGQEPITQVVGGLTRG